MAQQVFADEIAGLQAALERNRDRFDEAVQLLRQATGKVIVTGIGKSGIIGHKIAATFASTGTSAVFVNAGEALHGDLGVIAKGDVVLMLSNSAATVELARMTPTIRRIGAPIVGIFGRQDTPLAAACAVVLDGSVEKEACPLGLAPMTSATVALVLGDALAAALIEARGFTKEDFAIYHPSGQLGRTLLLRAEDLMHLDGDMPRVSPQTPFMEVLREMSRLNLGGVCVLDEHDVLVGFISDGDIRRHLEKGGALEVNAADLMTRDPITVAPGQTLGDVLDVMENRGRKIYVVPVADAQHRCVGLLRMHDIVDAR